MLDLFHLLSSPDVNWWTGVVWITCGLLWCFYQLFGLSFWRHPFTAEHPLLRHWCRDTFLQIWWRNKLIYISDDLRVRTFSACFHFWVNYSFNFQQTDHTSQKQRWYQFQVTGHSGSSMLACDLKRCSKGEWRLWSAEGRWEEGCISPHALTCAEYRPGLSASCRRACFAARWERNTGNEKKTGPASVRNAANLTEAEMILILCFMNHDSTVQSIALWGVENVGLE